ncbi:MAG: hypothetical protein ACFFC5_03585 [Promethearchaeota archaeon]
MIPIQRVVLYKHGVGYFERQGKVSGTTALKLKFKKAEMSDVLKSLSVIDLGGGRVSNVSYEAAPTVSKLLENIAVNVPETSSLTELIKQITGIRVEISLNGDKIQGRVLGIETAVEVEDNVKRDIHQLVLLREDSIMTVKLSDIKSFTVMDEDVKRDLTYFADVISDSKKEELKSVTVLFEGEGERDVAISYMVEVPVWKTSYRIIIFEDRTVLQGWAIVDNILDEDWEGVGLSLVAGLPISFRHDVYTPRYITRPEVEVEERLGIAPVELEEGVGEAERDRMKAYALADKPVPAAGPGLAKKARPYRGIMEPRMDRAVDTVETIAEAKEAGEFLVYNVTVPVTVKRNQSALVPILTSDVDGKKVLVYQERARRGNPIMCLELTNNSNLTLESGPVTVYEGGVYAGECMLPFMAENEKRFLPFAVDLETAVTREDKTKEETIHKVIVKGPVVETLYYRIREATYKIKNKTEEKKEIIIEHEKQHGFEPIDMDKPSEETASYYRWRVAVDPRETRKFEVKLRRLVSSSLSVVGITSAVLEFYLRNKLISEEESEYLSRIVKLAEEKASIEAEIAKLNDMQKKIFEDQPRLRDNIKSLGKTRQEDELRAKYVSKLSEQEDTLEKLKKRRDLLSSKSHKLQKEIDVAINEFAESRQDR